MERACKRHLDSLDSLFNFINDFALEHHLSESDSYGLKLAIEEIFVNMVRYNPDNTNDIVVELRADQDKVIVTLTDSDVERFDITKFTPNSIDRPIEDREPGGLGIRLVRSFMDEVSYDYRDRQGRITLTKYLGKANV
ncbi:MAG: ATP-binding protein [bacterium]|jgi:anti-sigma regulatory factor (Ser/Thr protein kinase)